MTAVTTNVLAAVGLALLCVFAFRLVFPLDPDPAKKVIRCGLATIVVFQLLARVYKIDLPFWVLASVVALVLLLCFFTLFLLIQQGYRALRRRKPD